MFPKEVIATIRFLPCWFWTPTPAHIINMSLLKLTSWLCDAKLCQSSDIWTLEKLCRESTVLQAPHDFTLCLYVDLTLKLGKLHSVWTQHDKLNKNLYLCCLWWRAHCVDGSGNQRWPASEPREWESEFLLQPQCPALLWTGQILQPGALHQLQTNQQSVISNVITF